MTDAPEENARYLFDPGLQLERTALAWRRTGLALTVGALVATRILPDVLGAWALIPAGFGLIAAVAIIVLAHRRHQPSAHDLLAANHDRVPLPSGLLLGAVTVLCIGGGIAALSVVWATGGLVG
jgi:putative membrane protein